MANLTEISIGVRKTSVVVIIILIIYFILRLIAGLAISYYQATHQPPPAPPDVKFGKIPKPNFPKGALTSSGLEFSLENIEGEPPTASEAATVYLMPKKTYTFESGEKARQLAKSMGFEEEEPTIDTVYFYYTSKTDPNRTLFIDGTQLNFQLRYNYVDNPEIFNLAPISSKEDAIDNAKDYLQYRRLFDDSVLSGKITSELLSYDGRLKKLVPAASLSSAQAIRINYLRNDINGMQVLTDQYNQSYTYVIYAPTPGKEVDNMLEISYFYWPISETEMGVYPLISGATAYQGLLDGKATIINKGENGNRIVIRNIYLAYYDSSTPQPYLQPVWVFDGDNQFQALYPAVPPDYLE